MNIMETGVYPGIAFKDYLAIPAISNSYLGRLDKCPAKVKVAQEDTPSLIFGRAVHKLVLEGISAFSAEFFKLPDVDRRTKEGKAEALAVMLANEGKTPLGAEVYLRVLAVQEAVFSHPFASKLLAENITEQTVAWTDKETGLPCKARPDAVPDEGKLTLIDLKTTTDASEMAFTRSIVKYGYARQAAFYLDGYNAATGAKLDAFIFIAVETEEPYRTEVYLLDDEFIDYGRGEYKRLLRVEQRCRAESRYPHYTNPGITQLYKPAYL